MIQARPIADSSSPAQQRFELELLLQEAVPDCNELEQAQPLLASHPLGVEPKHWRSLQALPLAIDDQTLVLAVPSHWGEDNRTALQKQLEIGTRRIHWRSALLSDLDQVLSSASEPKQRLPREISPEISELEESEPPGEPASLNTTIASFLDGFSADGLLEEDSDEPFTSSGDVVDLEASLKDAEASPVIALVDRILLQAMSIGASDIHVEPQQKGLQLRYRQDGVLQQYIEPLPSRLIPAVTSRFKILADLDIAERRQAQDGRIRRKYRQRVIDFRVSTLPSRFGESDAILESRSMVQEGVLLSTALTRQKVLPDMALNMLSIGEETGEMDKMLSKVANFYEYEVGAMVKALTSMLEPAMIVVVGGIVGSILLAMYLPMFTVFDQIA